MIGNPPPQLLGAAIEAAIAAARCAPCRKSRRGAAVFNPAAVYAPTAVIGAGFNGQPPPWRCDGTCTREVRPGVSVCSLVCVHAERRAIDAAIVQVAGYSGGMVTDLDGLDLVHIKVDHLGQPVPTGPPSCAACSLWVVEHRVAGVWLLERTPYADLPPELNLARRALETGIYPESPPRWVRYPGEEFHRLSLVAAGLSVSA